MASTKGYRDYVLERLSLLDNITYRPMMGEFLLYYNSILFGGIYDNRLLVKKVLGNKNYDMSEVYPYDGGKLMYLVDADSDILKNIVLDTYNDLKKFGNM